MVINNQLNNPNNIPPSNFDREDLKSLLKKELPDIIQRNFHLLSEDLNRGILKDGLCEELLNLFGKTLAGRDADSLALVRLFHQEKDTLHDDVKEIFSNISLARKRSLQSAYMFIRSSYDDLTANELSDIYRELRTYPDDQIEPFLRGMKGSKKQAAQELIQKVFGKVFLENLLSKDRQSIHRNLDALLESFNDPIVKQRFRNALDTNQIPQDVRSALDTLNSYALSLHEYQITGFIRYFQTLGLSEDGLIKLISFFQPTLTLDEIKKYLGYNDQELIQYLEDFFSNHPIGADIFSKLSIEQENFPPANRNGAPVQLFSRFLVENIFRDPILRLPIFIPQGANQNFIRNINQSGKFEDYLAQSNFERQTLRNRISQKYAYLIPDDQGSYFPGFNKELSKIENTKLSKSQSFLGAQNIQDGFQNGKGSLIEVNFPEASGVIGYFRILPLIDNTPQDGKNPLFRFQNCTGKDMKSYDDSEKNIINYSFDDLLDFFSNVSNVNIHTHDFFQQKIQEGKVGVLQDTQIPNKAALEGILNSLDNKDFPLEPGVIIELNENGKSENFEIEAIDDANITIKIDNHRFTFSLSDFYESIYKRYSARRFKRINSPLEALSVAQEVLSDSQDSLETFSKMSFNARTQEFDFDDKGKIERLRLLTGKIGDKEKVFYMSDYHHGGTITLIQGDPPDPKPKSDDPKWNQKGFSYNPYMKGEPELTYKLPWSRFLEFVKNNNLKARLVDDSNNDDILDSHPPHFKTSDANIAKSGKISSILDQMSHSRSFGELKTAVKHIFHGFKHVLEHGSEMNAISLEYEMLERMNAMGLISDAYLRESKTRLDNKNKEQIGKIVTDLTSSSGSEMRNRVAATLMNHHAPTYQIYGCLEAMLKKFGSIYSVQIAPSRPGEYLWYWTICNANHIPESTAKAMLIKIREELNQRQTPVTEMNILVLLFSEYLEKQGKAPQSFNKSLLRAFGEGANTTLEAGKSEVRQFKDTAGRLNYANGVIEEPSKYLGALDGVIAKGGSPEDVLEIGFVFALSNLRHRVEPTHLQTQLHNVYLGGNRYNTLYFSQNDQRNTAFRRAITFWIKEKFGERHEIYALWDKINSVPGGCLGKDAQLFWRAYGKEIAPLITVNDPSRFFWKNRNHPECKDFYETLESTSAAGSVMSDGFKEEGDYVDGKHGVSFHGFGVYDKEVGIAPGPGNFETKKMEDIYRRGIIQSFQNIRKYYNAGTISKDDAQAQYVYLHEKTLSLLMSRLAGVWTRDKHETLLPFQLARDGAGMTFQDSNNMNYLKTPAYKQHVEKDFKTFINGGMVPSTVIHDTHKKANDIFQNPGLQRSHSTI